MTENYYDVLLGYANELCDGESKEKRQAIEMINLCRNIK
jgi:hypothetical protein